MTFFIKGEDELLLVMGSWPSLHDMESVWTAANRQLSILCVPRPLIKSHCLICMKRDVFLQNKNTFCFEKQADF